MSTGQESRLDLLFRIEQQHRTVALLTLALKEDALLAPDSGSQFDQLASARAELVALEREHRRRYGRDWQDWLRNMLWG